MPRVLRSAIVLLCKRYERWNYAEGLHEEVITQSRDFLRGISCIMNFNQGIFLFFILCFTLSIHPIFLKRKPKYYYCAIVIFPPFVVNLVYWGVSMFSESREYINWWQIFIPPWLVAGYIGSLTGFLIVKLIKKWNRASQDLLKCKSQ